MKNREFKRGQEVGELENDVYSKDDEINNLQNKIYELERK